LCQWWSWCKMFKQVAGAVNTVTRWVQRTNQQ
jgi:uncharacterized protein YfiM (DUF2279 family)